MVKVFADSDKSQLENISQNEDTFDTLGASRYSFFSPAILQKFLSISLQKNRTLSPFCNSVYATVLFADISGFTRLSSHINVESLKKHINQFFTSLLGVVKEFNGDVIKFCGDAVMIMWPVPANATPGVKAATAYLAASCAMKLICDCGTYSKQEKGYKVLLRLHCGIGSGLVHCMCLGEGDRWEFLISGDPLRQVGIAESEAGIGEVCMSEESYGLVADRFESVEMPEGSRNLVLSKPQKKIRGTPTNELSISVQEKLQLPLESDLLNKLTNEQSRLTVGTNPDDDSKPSVLASDRKSHDSSPIGGSLESKSDHVSPFQSRQQIILENRKSSEEKENTDKSPLSVATSAPTPRRQNFFSPIFSHSPLTPSYDPSVDRELKKNISTAKSYLGEFACSGYIPPWNIVPYLHKFLMAPAKMAIENDTLNYLAELREVVTIFIEILGLEDDFNMGFVRRPQRVITIVIECLDRYMGSLRQYVVDDKGCVIIAAFGLPGSSHEDNCVRAIEAATSIRDNFLEIKIDCRIGIAKGVVYCGLVGSDDRCEYAMMGSSVNLAARLMSKGESGNILVNQDVQVATEKVFKFHALQKIKAKGYAKPVAVFIPYERIQTHELSVHKYKYDSMETNNVPLLYDMDSNESKILAKNIKKPQFIGREIELATFKKSLEIFVAFKEVMRESSSAEVKMSHSFAGSHQAHIVEGAAGAGKTWFIQEIIRMAKKMSGISHIYICASTGQTQKSSQYYIIGQLMEQIFGITIMNSLMKGEGKSTPKSALRSSQRNTTRDEIIAWFEKNDPDGRIISSRLISRVAEHNVSESLKSLPTRKSLLIRNGTISKFGRQYQKSLSIDASSSLELAMAPLKKRGFVPRVNSEELSSIPDFPQEDTQAPPEEVETKEFHYSHLLPLLSDILPVHIEDNLITASLSFTDRKTYCEALVMYILEIALERQKTLLIVENIHWCDCSSLTYISRWLKKKAGCFFLCTTRVSDDKGEVSSFQSFRPSPGKSEVSQTRRKSIKLEPKFQDIDAAHVINEIYQQCASTALHFFYREEIIKLLESILGPTLLSQYPLVLNRENIEKIRKHTDGSPILTHILAVELEDALRRGTFKSIDDLPSGTDALILSRFDKLSTRDQIILKVASVLGQTFTTTELYSVLYRLGDLSSSTGLADALTALVNSNLIQPSSQRRQLFNESSLNELGENGEGGGTYSFVNRSIQDGIYYLMLETQRKQTHAVIGSLLEEQLEMIGFNPVLLSAVTNHYMRSDNLSKKYEFLVRSAQIAKSKNDNYTANSHFDELVYMKTDRGVGDLLAACTDVSPRDKFLIFGSLFPNHSRYKLRHQESMKNIYDIEGFGADRKWIQVRELKSRFHTRELFSEKKVCVWIGEVARARFNLGDFRAAHNLYLLALFNAHLPLPKLDLEHCHWIRRDLTVSFHSSTDIWTYLAHCKIAQTNVSPTVASELNSIVLSFVQFYFYLALISFLYGSIERVIYLLEISRQLLPAISRDNITADVMTTEINVLALLAISFHYSGKSSKAQLLLSQIDQKCPNSLQPGHFSARLLGCAMIEIFCGSFKDSRIKFKRAIDMLGASNEGLMQHMVSLNLAWSLFLSGRLSESQSTLESVMSYAISTDHTTLLLWSYQLDMLVRVFAGEFANVEVIAMKVRNISRKDTYSSATSTILGLALLMQRKFDQALPCIRYACGKLSHSNHVSLQGYVLTFCALFSALCILKAQQTLSFQASTMECLAMIINDGLMKLNHASKTHGMLKLLLRSLILLCQHCPRYSYLFRSVIHENANVDDMNLAYEYNEFIFGRAYFYLLQAFAQSESTESMTDTHLREAEKLFTKLSPPNSRKVFVNTRNIIFSQSTSRSENLESLPFIPRMQSILSSSESAIPTLLSQSPRKKHTGLDLANNAEGSPPISQILSIHEQQHLQSEHEVGEVEDDFFSPVRVLVVDDAPTALKITSRLLTKIGCEVTTATNGQEAVDILTDLTKASLPWFNAIVLDLQMPIMDGLEACQLIREMESKLLRSSSTIYHTKQIIVAVSINADDATKEEAIGIGCDFFMPKPFRIDEFETILNLRGLALGR